MLATLQKFITVVLAAAALGWLAYFSHASPWLAWGPYLWANGTNKRDDGLFYERDDLGGDGTHPSATGARKVAKQLLEFFKTDATAKSWFVGS